MCSPERGGTVKKKLGIGTSFVILVSVVVALVGSSASAGNNGRTFRASLNGFNETPSVSTTGRGSFRLTINGSTMSYRLTYSGLEAAAAQAHIHFGDRDVAGGVVAFLCGGGDKPACPATGGTVTGTIDAADIVELAAQGIEAGAFAEVVRAIRANVTYVNVHTSKFPGGEIRGEIRGQ
jgi:hypothetical protein